MKAIFYDRNNDLVRCQFAGMNGKGEPDWLMIEQGEPTVTLAETERMENSNQHYRLLCLEGEEVGKPTLMRILCSFIQREIEGWGSVEDDICTFVRDMIKHRVEWNREKVCLRFRISNDCEFEGKFYLSITLGVGGVFLGAVEGITDLDQLLKLIDDFCFILEDSVHIEKVYRIADISSVDEKLLSVNLLSRFDRIMRKQD